MTSTDDLGMPMDRIEAFCRKGIERSGHSNMLGQSTSMGAISQCTR